MAQDRGPIVSQRRGASDYGNGPQIRVAWLVHSAPYSHSIVPGGLLVTS
jgi:hypothetical protein